MSARRCSAPARDRLSPASPPRRSVSRPAREIVVGLDVDDARAAGCCRRRSGRSLDFRNRLEVGRRCHAAAACCSRESRRGTRRRRARAPARSDARCAPCRSTRCSAITSARPPTASTAAAKRDSFSASVSVGDSPVVPATTRPSEPFSTRWTARCWKASEVDRAVLRERRDDCRQDLAEHPTSVLAPRSAGRPSRGRRRARSSDRGRGFDRRSSASRTPGTNASREVVSWLIVRVWPGRAEDDLLVRDEAGQTDGVDRNLARHAGGRRLRGARRCVELRLVMELDDLGSGQVRAASSANRIISTAPIAKFGTTRHGTPRERARPSSSAKPSSVRPVVPIRQGTSPESTRRALPSTAPGAVKSTAASWFPSEGSSPTSTPVTSCPASASRGPRSDPTFPSRPKRRTLTPLQAR